MIANQANQTIGATLIDASTGAAFAGVVTVYVTIDAGVQAIGTVGAGIATAEGQSYFTYRPSQAETNGALIAFTFTGPGAIPATIQVATISAAQQAQLNVLNTSPAAVTGLDIVTRALQTLGVYALGDSIPGMEATDGLTRLNSMIGSWAIQPLTIPLISRTVWPLVAGKGSEANPYLIGPTAGAGNFVTATVPHDLEGAGILWGNMPTPYVESPRAVLNDQQWASIAVKDMSSPIFTAVFYSPSVPNGEIVLWPVPDTNLHSLVLYRGEQLPVFANLSTSYTLPDGYVEALDYNLAVRMAPSKGVAVSPDLAALARMSLATLKRANQRMTDLENDFAYGGRGYDIQTGNM